ncbi:hypothetical protein [Hyphococcus sp.]|uniref:hypothetical protein n=1 Tax=Hyphococcus sp. TaxID=2038636 RepID=UPI002089657D|nr:MAG: hypothetical protein DHS20C04_17990 [Marinicaulis sp.]
MHIIGETFGFISLLCEIAVGALSFSAKPFARAAGSGEAQTAALTIAFLAGVSEMLGQSVILVINRVALYRFLASLAFTGFTYVLTALAWALSAIAVAPLTRLGVLTPNEIAGVFGVVSLSFAPRLFGALAMAPYFGQALGNLLEALAMMLAIFGLHAGFGLPLHAALFCGGAGWVLSYFMRAYLGHALAKPLGRLRLAVSGSPLELTPQQIIDDLARRISGGGQS